MKTYTTYEMLDLLQKEIDANFNELENTALHCEYRLGVLQSNKRFIDLQRSILDNM